MLRTRFTELLGCSVPLQQAGMGSLANPRLAKAVADAGALGMVSLTGQPPETVARVLDDLGKQTSGVFGANFIIPLDEPDNIEKAAEVAAKRARVVEFFYDWPDPALVKIVHSQGAIVSWQIGSVEEASAASESGCDLIVAQGIEAGGHVRGKISLLALLDEVLESVEVPVIAAGGIGSGRAMAAALAAGAAAVRIGTRFVAAEEAEAHPDYVRALIGKKAGDTVYTDKFSVGWPNAPHRVLRSSLETAEAFQGDIVGEHTSLYSGGKWPVHKFEILSPTKSTTGNIEAMPLWAGESVDGVKKIQSAAEIVNELVSRAEEYLNTWRS